MKTLLLLSSLFIGQLVSAPVADYTGNWYNASNGITMQFQQRGTILSCYFRTAQGYTHRAEGPVWTNANGQQVARYLLKRTTPDGCTSFLDCRLTFLSDTRVQINASAVDNNCDLALTWRDVAIYDRQ